MNAISSHPNMWCAALCISQLLYFSSLAHGQQSQQTEQPTQSGTQTQAHTSQPSHDPRLYVPSLGPLDRYDGLITGVGHFDAVETGKIAKPTNEVPFDWNQFMLKRVGLRQDEWTAIYNIIVDAYDRKNELTRQAVNVHLHSDRSADTTSQPTVEEKKEQYRLIIEGTNVIHETITKLQKELGREAFTKLDNELCAQYDPGSNCKNYPTPFPYQRPTPPPFPSHHAPIAAPSPSPN
jgi:hypothetical protein